MDEFVSFIQAFPNSEDGLKAKAQYYIGVIFDRAEQYADSVKAYDAVLERYPENPATRDALYGKAVALMNLDRNTEAKKEFNAFLKQYSTDDKAAQARQYLKELNGPARPASSTKKGVANGRTLLVFLALGGMWVAYAQNPQGKQAPAAQTKAPRRSA